MNPRLKRGLTTFVLLLPGLGLIVTFVGVVLYFAISQSFGQFDPMGNSHWTTEYWSETLHERRFWTTLFYSLRIATLSAILAVSVAYPLALWLREPFRGSSTVGAILKIPMLVPGLVAAFLYVNFISYNGFLNHILIWTGFTDEPIRMQNDPWGIGVLVLQTWKQMPMALLLLLGVVRTINPEVLSAAQDVGANAWNRFVHVILPLTLQTLQAAMIIIFIGAAGDFSFQVVAGPRNPQSLAQFMESTVSSGGGRNLGATVGIALMVVSLVGSLALAGLTRLLVNRRSYA